MKQSLSNIELLKVKNQAMWTKLFKLQEFCYVFQQLEIIELKCYVFYLNYGKSKGVSVYCHNTCYKSFDNIVDVLHSHIL